MQAQNASERKKSKKGRQYPTPPTRSKASRLGITKKFINFLLDHDEAHLKSASVGQGQHLRLRRTEKLAYLGHVRNAGLRESSLEVRDRNLVLLQQESDVIDVVFISARHFGEHQVQDGRAPHREFG